MILVDKDIKKFVSDGMNSTPSLDIEGTVIFNGINDNITNIGYDLRVDKIIRQDEQLDSTTLNPGDSVFVSSVETIKFGNAVSGRICLKNSRIRMGLSLDSPVYQPGHLTKVFFRLTNCSNSAITISHGQKYATVIFEQLSECPDTPYNGAFQEEEEFSKLSRYTSEYSEQMTAVEKKIENLESVEKRIYGNIVTILTIFVAIFSLLNINIVLSITAASAKDFLVYNLANLGAVSFLAALTDSILNRKKAIRLLWLIPIVCFIALLFVVLLVK